MKHAHANQAELGRIFLNLIILLFFVILCAVLYLARRPILRFTAEFLIIEDPLDKADALIVLGDDNFYADRATRGAQLFREGKAPVIIASGRRLRPNAGIAELMEHDLVERGVPRDKIVRFAHDADSTLEEAQALAQFAKERKWHSVIVVTSNFHTRRARYIFRHVFPHGMQVRVAAARDGDFDPDHWWERRKSIKGLTREFAGMVVTLWELRGRRETGETRETTQSVVDLRELNPQLVVWLLNSHTRFATRHSCLQSVSRVLSSLFLVAVPTSPAASGSEKPIFDVEVLDVEKRRFEV
jgi:vancomycin permeability regulator SanA